MYLDRLIHLTGAVVVEYITISASQIFLFLIILLDILNIAAFSASVLKVLGGLSWTTRCQYVQSIRESLFVFDYCTILKPFEARFSHFQTVLFA